MSRQVSWTKPPALSEIGFDSLHLSWTQGKTNSKAEYQLNKDYNWIRRSERVTPFFHIFPFHLLFISFSTFPFIIFTKFYNLTFRTSLVEPTITVASPSSLKIKGWHCPTILSSASGEQEAPVPAAVGNPVPSILPHSSLGDTASAALLLAIFPNYGAER